MAEKSLTIYHIKSHLQKFRNQYRGGGEGGTRVNQQPPLPTPQQSTQIKSEIEFEIEIEEAQIAATTSTEPEQGSVLCIPTTAPVLTRSSSRDIFDTFGTFPASNASNAGNAPNAGNVGNVGNVHLMHQLDQFIARQNKVGQDLQQQLMHQYQVKRDLEISGQQLNSIYNLVKGQTRPPQQILENLFSSREAIGSLQQEELQFQQQHQQQQQQQQQSPQQQQIYQSWVDQWMKQQRQQYQQQQQQQQQQKQQPSSTQF